MTLRLSAFAVTAVALLGLAAGRPPVAESATRALDITNVVHPVDDGGDTLRQRGTFAGAPLGSGTVNLVTKVGEGDGATVTFSMVNARGSVQGTGNLSLQFKGATIIYRGTAKITRGTGAFRSIRAKGLRVSGSGPLSGETFKVRMTGSVSL
jgi:hypothetical protein